MTSRILQRHWVWTVGAPALAALGALILTTAAYRYSPTIALALLVAVGGSIAVAARPMLGIYAGVLCAPLEYLDLKIGVAGLTAGEGVLLVTAVCVLLRMLLGVELRRMSLVHGAFAALIMVTAVGLVFAPNTVVVAKIVLMWSAFLVLSLFVAQADREELRWMLVAIAVSGALLGILAVKSGQTIELRGGGTTATNRAQASFAHPAVLAFFLVLALPCAISLALGDRVLLRAPMLIAAALILAALMLTLTRGAIIGAALSMLSMCALPRFRVLATGLIVGLIVFSAFNLDPILNSPQASVVETRLGTIGGERHTNPRLRIYQGAPRIVADHPVFGIGAGNFPQVAALYGLRDFGGDLFEHAHDLFLTIAVETGLLGLAALLAFSWGLWREAAVILRKRRQPEAVLPMAPVAAIVGLFGSSITDYPLRTNLVMAVFMLHAGALVAYARSSRAAERPMNA
jgi:putative inorganic carbon (HCO3(-)) transporter